jgi:hypothetical protein
MLNEREARTREIICEEIFERDSPRSGLKESRSRFARGTPSHLTLRSSGSPLRPLI